MEEDIHLYAGLEHDLSKAKQLAADRLEEAVKIAQQRIDYEAAHNPAILEALAVVKAFLVRKGRVCYGGTAMNAILPESKQFYNPEYDLPDYDFFSPAIEEDVVELVEDLKRAGFKDVYHRVGMHEGTKKIMVNFVPIADISHIQQDLYDIFVKRSVKKGGVRYTDPDILRMMMYLELSRPKGEVDRWKKVFERLELINGVFPYKKPAKTCKAKRDTVPIEFQRVIYDYIIENQRILCNGPLEKLYSRSLRSGKVTFPIPPKGERGPILFMSQTARGDAKQLKELLGTDVTLFLHKAHGDLVPERAEIRIHDKPVAMIIQEVACHSYNTVPLTDGRSILIGSPELLITLYLAIGIFTKSMPELQCRVKTLLDISQRNYTASSGYFPAFSLSCKGYQKGYATLLREKVARIKKLKNAGTKTRKKKSEDK